MKPKIVIAINTSWNLYNFRTGMIRALVRQGYDVLAIAPADEYSGQLADHGCRFQHIPMDNHGIDPTKDFLLFLRYFAILRRERPVVFLGYTIKPNIYGSMAAHLLGISVINNVTGLGRAFAKQDLLSRLAGMLYRIAFSRSAKVFFQNEEDRHEFISRKIIRREVTERLPGSGIDLARFSFQARLSELTEDSRRFTFLLVGRMLWEKGVSVFVDAARIVQQHFSNVRFRLLGFIEDRAGGAVPLWQIREWEMEGVITYGGSSDDVRGEMLSSDCVVLPSYYREGVPRTLLEAAALGKPIITTDTSGCREVVDNEVNGFLCRPKDADDLAAKMLLMIAVSDERRIAMGIAGREKVEREFDERIVVARYLEQIAVLASSSPLF